jgi:magnesium transporter
VPAVATATAAAGTWISNPGRANAESPGQRPGLFDSGIQEESGAGALEGVDARPGAFTINAAIVAPRIPVVTNHSHEAGHRVEDPESGIRIRLFDADRTDRLMSFDEAMASQASARQMLWIDIEGEIPQQRRRALVERFELDPATARALEDPDSRPYVQLHGKYFHLRVAAEPDPEHSKPARWLDLVAGPNVVISKHADPLDFLGAINARIAADATIGELDSPEFVASVLDAIITTYHAAIDRLEDELDAFNARALSRPRANQQFAELVAIQRRIGRLRRLLTAHRELFGSLGRRDFGVGIASADPEVFLPVVSRFEGALASVESTRDVVMSSFDVLMTRTAQRTNDVMRVLTLATVLALPATITAGFLGMNLIVPLPKDDPNAFWVVMGAVLAFEAIVLGLARWRRWI